MTDWYNEGASHIWHPYTQMKTAANPLPVVGADGTRLKLADGRELIDGIASWWSACHGHNHPHLRQAIETQLHTLPHIMFGGLAHEPAYRLATRLAKLTGLERVFFSDSGSTAVEVAMKMGIQYWRNQGDKNRHKFVCFRHSYHGDTMGAMSLSDPDEGMHKLFSGHIPMQYVIDLPTDEYSFAEMDGLFKDVSRYAAGVVIEPLVQAAGGMKFHSPDVLAEIYRLSKKHGLLFIADEVATGFGRTGLMFACQEAGIVPDIMCVGKGLTGGMIGMAATLVTDTVYDTFYADEPDKALMHGPTFMANPLACAAANASLDLFEREPRLQQVEAIEAQLLEELKPCARLPGVVDVRVKGAIGVVQLDHETSPLKPAFIEQGIWLRPFGDVIYVMPSFTITAEELSAITAAILKVCE